MGLEVIAAVALASTAYSAYEGYKARKDQKRAGEKVRSEQNAQNAAKSALERRQQIREERVRRARILQAGENSGTSESTLEAGALGSLATTLSANMGFSAGEAMRNSNISVYAQRGANAATDAANADALFSVSGQIFQAAGGFSSAKNIFQSDPVSDYITGTGGINK